MKTLLLSGGIHTGLRWSAASILMSALLPVGLWAAPVQLTTNSGNDLHPRWHPGGTTIAYMRFDGVDYEPARVNTNATGDAFLATGVNVALNSAAISWLGNSGILLVAEVNFFHELFAFNTTLAPFSRTTADGNDAAFTRKLLVPGGRNSSAFISSRDGQMAAWRDSPNVGTPTTIRAATFSSLANQNTDAHGVTVLSHTSPVIGSRGMALTPNGSHLVISVPSGAGFDLYIYSTSGTGTPFQLTTTGTTHGYLNFSPDVSPDGNYVLFQSSPAGAAGTTDIYRINITGNGLVQITSTAGVDEAAPSYAPDGVQYAYQRLDGSQWNIYRDTITLPEIAVEHPAGTDLVDGTAIIDFGTINLGSSSGAEIVSVKNLGDTILSGLAITKSGFHAADFSVGTLGATTLAPGASTTFTVTFTPGAAGERDAVLHLASNDADENPFDINLTGTGNTLPQAQNAEYTRALGLGLKIQIATLLANSTSDADGDARSLSAVGASTQGATISTTSAFIFYTPANHNNDSFSYTISDGRGGAATATISVNVENPGGLAQSITSSGGMVTVNFAGVPTYEYDIQRATEVNGQWTTVDTRVAPANGLFSYSETPPSSPAFYRLIRH